MVCEVKQNESRSVVSSFLQPHRLYSPWNPPGQNTGEWVAFPFSRGSSQTGDWTQVSHIAGGSWRAEPQEKLKNTVLASLPLLQQIFPTQKSNWGLLHCRWILNHWTIREVPWGLYSHFKSFICTYFLAIDEVNGWLGWKILLFNHFYYSPKQ